MNYEMEEPEIIANDEPLTIGVTGGGPHGTPREVFISRNRSLCYAVAVVVVDRYVSDGGDTQQCPGVVVKLFGRQLVSDNPDPGAAWDAAEEYADALNQLYAAKARLGGYSDDDNARVQSWALN